ncbi:hypothetical protein G7068_09055 [Leucobacter viscericola]|uniref:Uncharacterized protein n=1 Tax=Leucobacter viscericola TaxID=2714935 RepID=A0A6G7XFE1_9MICO|nr:hypothetical protein [Leucobacter viscericola]QIK63330.1 hypothetical protein G7068_09055 [Leucobacter viscericola]
MSNTITVGRGTPFEQSLTLANGLTSVFVSLLGLSGTATAADNKERVLVYWLLEQDQSAVGVGTVGFELEDLPFEENEFESQRVFLLSAIDGVIKRIGWDRLSYKPNEDLIFPAMHRFAELVRALRITDLHREEIAEWHEACQADEPMFRGFPVCGGHGLLLTRFGCHACNNS